MKKILDDFGIFILCRVKKIIMKSYPTPYFEIIVKRLEECGLKLFTIVISE